MPVDADSAAGIQKLLKRKCHRVALCAASPLIGTNTQNLKAHISRCRCRVACVRIAQRAVSTSLPVLAISLARLSRDWHRLLFIQEN
ncbi:MULTISPECIES: hypothetical protein [unclassified Caballeronia]|uniref:hypothetical protein n=1 Tax=unclassified Caballeronia TaxID=2646786 RepID=UPI0013ECFC6F|nr:MULTISPECIES: hypothetical protein [unclassified Caballeronia]